MENLLEEWKGVRSRKWMRRIGCKCAELVGGNVPVEKFVPSKEYSALLRGWLES